MDNNTVMIIEDDVIHMKLFTDVLEHQGYKTLNAPDGEMAMDIARESQPDLIILNIRLPMTSGFDVIKKLRKEDNLKNIPVVAVIAQDDDMNKNNYLRHVFDDFLAKPIAIPNFIRTITDLFPQGPHLVH